MLPSERRPVLLRRCIGDDWSEVAGCLERNVFRRSAMRAGLVTLIGAVAAPSGAQTYGSAPDPVADLAAVVVSGNVRVTVLTPRLVRLEWSPAGVFEDRASFTFVNRRLPVPPYTRETQPGGVVVQTDALTVKYTGGGARLATENLAIDFRAPDGEPVRWKPGMRGVGNLKGTTRTLDGASGARPLEDGVLSRDGWTLIDDSARPLFDHSDWPWATPRPDGGQDWYFLLCGHDYVRALQDYAAVTGHVPLPPKYVFGAWWSRYWPYSAAEFKTLVGEFREHDVPLDVLVVDMDWHLKGWTGYTWDPNYFPDPARFLKWTATQGLEVPLNLHPAQGVGKHEAGFADMCRALGLDPAKTEKIPFDCTDRRFVEAYFEYLLRPLERQGVDFWWMDWQQGTKTKLAGVDPLFWLNYLFWTDWERDPGSRQPRPLVFSRWGGLGNHRYPIGFSGDTFSNWQSLAFQPYFTATAGNVLFGYWSHDIGGHLRGVVEPELYARWVQWGALSPVLRTHTTRNSDAERRLWAFERPYFQAMREAFQFRYALLPYIYTMARQTTDTTLPLCRPLYYEWPELSPAYAARDEYLFGDSFLVAPAVEPVDAESGCTPVKLWLPPGTWRHWYTGREYRGARDDVLQTPLEEVPLLVRAPAIIPMQPPMRYSGEKPVDPLIVQVIGTAGIDGGETAEFKLYEDDGLSRDYAWGAGRWATTRLELKRVGPRWWVTLGPTDGRYEGMPEKRGYEVHLRDVLPAERVLLNGNPVPRRAGSDAAGAAAGGADAAEHAAAEWWYDPVTLSVVVRVPSAPVMDPALVEVTLQRDLAVETLLSRGLREALTVCRLARADLGDRTPPVIEQAARLGALLAEDTPAGCTTVKEFARNLAKGTGELPRALREAPLPEVRQTELLTRLMQLNAK
jgi:alpha-glucosidase